MRRILSSLLGALVLSGLAGCSHQLSNVPSLAPRAAERQPILSPDAATEPKIAASPTLAADLVRLVGEAKAAHAAFEKEQRALEPVIARGKGATEGSEPWIAGQEAVSALSSRQGGVREAAAAIDALRSDPAHGAEADRTAMDAAAEEVARLVEAEAKAIAALG